MNAAISRLVDQFESGTISRRQLVAGIGGLMAMAGVSEWPTDAFQEADKQEEPTFHATDLNHIALRVTDVGKSRDFYVKHLGLEVTRENDRQCFLNCGDQNFVALFKGEKAGMDHYCYSMKDYDVDEVEAKLNEQHIRPRVVRPDGRIYFKDPDGLTVQLAQRPERR